MSTRAARYFRIRGHLPIGLYKSTEAAMSKKSTRLTPKKTAKPFEPLITPEIQARFNKAIDRITHPRPEPIQFRGMGPSIADRLARIRTLVTLIAAAATYDNDGLSEGDVLDAIREAANKAADHLYWISGAHMPASIGNLPALTDDEYQAHGVDAGEEEERDDFMRARMREMLDGVQR